MHKGIRRGAREWLFDATAVEIQNHPISLDHDGSRKRGPKLHAKARRSAVVAWRRGHGFTVWVLVAHGMLSTDSCTSHLT